MYYVRAAALLAVLGSIIAATGCSGGAGGAAPPLPATQQPNTNTPNNPNNPTVSPTSQFAQTTGSLSYVSGPITGLLSNGGFQINAGSGIGYVYIQPNSSTHEFYGGLSPKVGEYASLVTSSSLGGSTLTPLAVSLYSSSVPSSTLTGTVTSAQSYGIAIKLDSNGSYIGVALSTKTAISGSIAVGQHISAAGP